MQTRLVCDSMYRPGWCRIPHLDQVGVEFHIWSGLAWDSMHRQCWSGILFVAQAGLELIAIFLSSSLECWDDRQALSHHSTVSANLVSPWGLLNKYLVLEVFKY